MADRVEITIKAIDKASKELDSVKRELGGMEKQGQKTNRSFGQMASTVATVTAGIAAFGYAAKQAFEIAKQGAELDLTRQRFDRLAESMGATSDVMLRDITKAMGGMASQAEAVQLATELMSLGLVKTREQAVRMTGVAGQLNMDMNQLALTLANKTTMRFDSLGVSIDGFNEKVDILSETMSDQDAFTMAFLSQAEEQIEKVGSAADTAAGEIARFEAGWSDYFDNIKRKTASVLLPMIEQSNRQREAFEAVEEAQRLGIITAEEAARTTRKLGSYQIDNVEVLEDLAARTEVFSSAAQRNAQILDLGREPLRAWDERNEQLARRMEAVRDRTNEAASAVSGNLRPAWANSLDTFDSAAERLDAILSRLYAMQGVGKLDTGVGAALDVANAALGAGERKLAGIVGATGGGGSVSFEASGGPLGKGGDAAVVGEEGYEFIFKDKNGEWIVVPHGQSKMLAQMGVIPDRGLYFGGPLGGGGGGPIPDDPYLPGSGGVKVPGGGLSAPVPPGVYLEGSRTSPSSGGTSSTTSSSQQQAQQAATAAATSVGAQTTAAVVQSSQDTSQRFLNQFVEEQRKERQPLLDALGELKIEMRRLPQRLVDSLVLSGEV